MIRKNFFSILVALIILYLSLAGSNTFGKVTFMKFPNADKLIHFLMFSGLMAVILIEHRRSAASKKQILRLALFPFCYGLLLELAQILTSSRSGDLLDGLADTAGIIFTLILWALFRPFLKIR